MEKRTSIDFIRIPVARSPQTTQSKGSWLTPNVLFEVEFNPKAIVLAESRIPWSRGKHSSFVSHLIIVNVSGNSPLTRARCTRKKRKRRRKMRHVRRVWYLLLRFSLLLMNQNDNVEINILREWEKERKKDKMSERMKKNVFCSTMMKDFSLHRIDTRSQCVIDWTTKSFRLSAYSSWRRQVDRVIQSFSFLFSSRLLAPDVFFSHSEEEKIRTVVFSFQSETFDSHCYYEPVEAIKRVQSTNYTHNRSLKIKRNDQLTSGDSKNQFRFHSMMKRNPIFVQCRVFSKSPSINLFDWYLSHKVAQFHFASSKFFIVFCQHDQKTRDQRHQFDVDDAQNEWQKSDRSSQTFYYVIIGQ